MEIQAQSKRQWNLYRSPVGSFSFHWLSEISRNTASILCKRLPLIIKKTFWAGETTDGVMFDTLNGSGKEMLNHG